MKNVRNLWVCCCCFVFFVCFGFVLFFWFFTLFFLFTARLTPVHFKRAYLTAGNSKQDAAKSSPKQTFLGFKKPQKKKVKFSVQETEYLMAGIKRYGFGNWAVILSKYPFHPSRDKVSLKDKARNLRGR